MISHRFHIPPKSPGQCSQTVPQQVYKGICLRCNTLIQAQLQANQPCEGVSDFPSRGSIDRWRSHDEEDFEENNRYSQGDHPHRSPRSPRGRDEGEERADQRNGRGGLVHTSHHQSGVPAAVSAPPRDTDDVSVLTWDTSIIDSRENLGGVTQDSIARELEMISEEYRVDETIDSSTWLHSSQRQLERSRNDRSQAELVQPGIGSSQSELERSNSLTRGDNPRLGSGGSSQGNTGIMRSDSFQEEQDLNHSRRNDSCRET